MAMNSSFSLLLHRSTDHGMWWVQWHFVQVVIVSLQIIRRMFKLSTWWFLKSLKHCTPPLSRAPGLRWLGHWSDWPRSFGDIVIVEAGMRLQPLSTCFICLRFVWTSVKRLIIVFHDSSALIHTEYHVSIKGEDTDWENLFLIFECCVPEPLFRDITDTTAGKHAHNLGWGLIHHRLYRQAGESRSCINGCW